jgi:MHS family proline/betaine transporter-like MFS transporter
METSEEQKIHRMNKFYGAIGAVVEWYDLMLYGYLAVVFARVFFPETAGPGVALAGALGGFAIGFLMRPVGGLFFGWMGDRHGRKLALMVAISMMTVPMLGTALLPGYAEWGWLAPVLLILMRMVMGFSSGGEYSGTLVFLVEGAKRGHRGRTTAIATAYSGVGILLASAVVTVLSLLTTDEQMDTWGWRVPYLFGSLIIVVAIFMRSKMRETPRFEALAEAGQISETPLRDAVRMHWRTILAIMCLAGYGGVTYFLVLTYLVSYLENSVGIGHDQALILGTVLAALFVVTAFAFGRFTDRVGRKKPMLWSAVAFVVISVPVFLLLNTGNLVLIYAASLVLIVPVLAFNGAMYVAVTEYLPTQQRAAGMGIGYNLGVALFGSTAPFVAQLLINATGRPEIPAYYLVFASLLIIPVILKLPETAFDKLEDVTGAVPIQHAPAPPEKSPETP